jgi:ADP-ribosylglycohydrolase/fructose-1,6-bisphosphatase/inositol monophosphatase family enzyme
MIDYQLQLQAAITAAQAAGDLLRQDFNRPGGPSGQDAHSPSDNEAEAIIRQQLSAAFPDYGQRGEELGYLNKPAQDANQHIWSIDPNDGTSAYIKGWRGAAVSIALLRQGVPVLGVVYAYSELSGFGDLIAWAEGQPLTRNGVVVNPKQAPLQPNIVLISQNADKHANVTASLCSPYRYRISPSIAYRLALTAVGEAFAAVSLVSPTVWDVAAGHALLRAVDMDLFKKDGSPVRYDALGYGDVGDCIGCKTDLVSIWTTQDWKNPVAQPSAKTVLYSLIKPDPKKIIADADQLNRAQGCLAGLLAGDNLGSMVEFLTPAEIKQKYPNGLHELVDGGVFQLMAGQPTDDGELALMLARSIVNANGYHAEEAAKAYQYWYHSDPFDVGATIGGAFGKSSTAASDSFAQTCRSAASAHATSQANGALMRIAPLAIWGSGLDNNDLAELARQDATLSHQHPVCLDANAVFCVALKAAINGNSARAVYEQTLSWSRTQGIHPDVIAALIAAEHNPPQDYMTHMGWVLIALQNAFYQLLHAENAEQGIKASLLAGGDTDTNASIAGALLGAVYGAQSLPRQWVHALLSARAITESGSLTPRPESFWSVDCLMLAERLVWMGQKK